MRTVPIEGYEHRYTISENGDVISIGYGIVMKTVLWSGYPKVNLYKGNGYKTYHIHRLLATHFIDNPYNLPLVNHINGDRKDNRLENLEWVTASYNVKDGFNRGRVHPQQGKRHVDRNRICEWCKDSFVYLKHRQRFCDKTCSNAYNRSKIKPNRKRDNMGRFTIALHEAGELK